VSKAAQTIRIADVLINGDRKRKDLGDLGSLKASLGEIGILHPIVVTTKNELVCGARRLTAAREIGWEEIPVRIIDLERIAQGERDENFCRKDLNPVEAVETARALWDLEEAKAKERHKEGSSVGGLGGRDEGSGKFPEPSGEETRDAVAATVGMSGKTLEHAIAVVEAAEIEPDKYGEILEAMRESGKVDPAYKKVKGIKAKEKAEGTNDDLDALEALGVKLQPYDVWNFPTCLEGFGSAYPGRVPAQIVLHCLYFWTKRGDLVVDPMSGSGTTIDSCKAMGRDVLGYDARPSRDDIIKHDILETGKWPKGTADAKLIFWDPPYFKKVDDGYSDQSISRLERAGYLKFFSDMANAIPKTFRGHMAFLMSAFDDEEDVDKSIWVWDYVKAFMKSDRWRVIRHIEAPLSTQQVHPDIVNKFKQSRKLARLARDLVVFQVV
jgi:hypothetical protein